MKRSTQEVKHMLTDKIKSMSPEELQDFVLSLGLEIYWDGKNFVTNEDTYERRSGYANHYGFGSANSYRGR